MRTVLRKQQASAPPDGGPLPAARLVPRPPFLRRRGWWLTVLAAILVTAAGFGLLYRNVRPQFQPAAAYVSRTFEVRSGTIERTIRLSGSTAAEHSVHLRAPYLRGRRSGGGGAGDFATVIQELCPAGAWVRKGDPVATFDRLRMENRLDDYRAARADRDAEVARLEAEFELRRAVHQQQVRIAKGRMDQAVLDLKTAPVRSDIQAAILRLAFEEARATYNALLRQTRWVEAAGSADLERARLDLREALVEERRAEANLERLIVRAPIDGLFVPGEIFHGGQFLQVRAGDQLRPGQPYAQIVDPRTMIVEARVNQADVPQFQIGAPVHVCFDAYPGLKLAARVKSVGLLGTSTGWRREYVAEVPVVIGLDRTDPRLIPNLSVSADVVLRSERSAGIVAREALFYPEDEGRPHVRVRTPSGWQHRAVELGLSNNIAVAVRSGVRAGEVVAAEAGDNTG